MPDRGQYRAESGDINPEARSRINAWDSQPPTSLLHFSKGISCYLESGIQSLEVVANDVKFCSIFAFQWGSPKHYKITFVTAYIYTLDFVSSCLFETMLKKSLLLRYTFTKSMLDCLWYNFHETT